MSRVEIASQGWGWVADQHGEGQGGASVLIKNLDGSNATHWSAITGGSSTTGAISTNADGTIPRFIEAGQYDVTVGAVTRRVDATPGTVESNITSVSPKQFNGDPTGVVDATPAIALALAEGVPVDLGGPENTWKIADLIEIPSGAKILSRGATIDLSDVAATGSYKIGARAQGTVGSTLALSANGNKGEFTVTLSDASSLAAGDWVRLSSGADFPWTSGFKRGEIKRIRTIATNTLTFEQALYDDYATADTAVVRKITMVEDIEFHGVRFVGSDTAAALEKGIALEFVNGFTINDCRFQDIDLHSAYVRSSVHGTVNDNRFRGVFYDGVTGSSFYGVVFVGAAQWVTCEGNVGNRLRHLVTSTAEASDPGCPRHITVDGNVAENMMAGGGGRSWAFEHHGIGENIVFSNNVADGCYGGFVTRGPGVSFIGNKVRNWYAYALHIHPEIEDCRDINISGNTVEDRSKDGGSGFATPACVRVELDAATVIRNVVIADNTLTQDVAGQAAIKADDASVTADSFVVKGNTIYHPSASVDSIDLAVPGAVRSKNIINGVLEGDSTLESTRSSEVSTMPRQMVEATSGSIATGQIVAGRARVVQGGTYSKIRFATGGTIPSLTDIRAGVWNTSNTLLAATANEVATVTAASTVYELSLTSPITLKAGDEVFLGVGQLGTTPTPLAGNPGVTNVNAVTPSVCRRATGWAGGTLPSLSSSWAVHPWVELVP